MILKKRLRRKLWPIGRIPGIEGVNPVFGELELPLLEHSFRKPDFLVLDPVFSLLGWQFQASLVYSFNPPLLLNYPEPVT